MNKWYQWSLMLLMGLISAMLCACGSQVQEDTLVLFTREQETVQSAVSQTELHLITVYLCGEVKEPGVYQLAEPARLYQAVAAAGGFSQDAAREQVNLAKLIGDGEQITIPKFTEEQFSVQASETKGTDGRVDINHAQLLELMQLPGIGEVKAGAIIAYRESEGLFTKIEDIMKVPGIKESAFQQIADRITVNR